MERIGYGAVSGLFLTLCGLGLLLFPAQVSAGVLEGVSLCLNQLLPALFPFMVLSSMVIRLGLAEGLGRLLAPVMEGVFRLPGVCALPLLLGMVGGYPTGAATALRLYGEGLCSREEAEHLLSFCNLCGPAFFIGAVGGGLLDSSRLGGILYLIHLLGALLTGRLLRGHRPPQTDHTITKRSDPPSFSSALSRSVTGAMEGILRLSAFVICFSALNALLRASRLLPLLTKAVSPLLGPGTEGLLVGVLEMTGGVFALKEGPIALRLPAVAFLTGWGGLCVHLQVISLMEDTDLSPGTYLKGKAIHGLICGGVILLFLWGETLWCLLGGGTLLLLPQKMAKKRGGKRVESIL